MKKFLCLIFFLIIIMSGCSNNNNYANNILVNKSTQKNAEKDISKISSWPENHFTDQIPKFTKGNNYVINITDTDGFVFGAYNVLESDYNNYIKDVEYYGFTENILEMTGATKGFNASNGKYQIIITYYERYISITVTMN